MIIKLDLQIVRILWHLVKKKKKKENNIRVLQPFQEYCPNIELIVHQKWAKTGVPREKPPDLLVQNLASQMCPEQGSKLIGNRSNVSQHSKPLDDGGRYSI